KLDWSRSHRSPDYRSTPPGPPLQRLGSAILLRPAGFQIRQPYRFFRLNLTGLGVFVTNHADGLARTFARPRVGRSALATDRQPAAMPDSAIAINRLKPLKIALHFTPQIAFDLNL